METQEEYIARNQRSGTVSIWAVLNRTGLGFLIDLLLRRCQLASMDLGGIALDKAEVLSVSLEAVLYGFSSFMFCVTIWVLFYQRSTMYVNWRMVLVACMLFILSTLHIGVNTYRCIVGTIYHRDDTPGGPSTYFGDLKAFPFIFLNVVYMLQTLLGDSVVIYRCYVVWQSFHIIIFPVIMLTASLVTGIGGIWASSTLPSGSAIFAKGAANWITSFYSLSMATNVVCTSLLVYRIWKTAADVRRHLTTSALPLMSVLLVIVDAALLYTFTLLTSLILFAIGSNAQDLIVCMMVPIISITFYMVIMRSGLAKLPPSPRSTAERAAAAAATESRMAFDPSPFIERMTYVTGLDREIDIESGVDTEDDGLDNFEAAPNASLVKIPRQMHVSPSCSQSDLSLRIG